MDKYKPIANITFIIGLITIALTPFFYSYEYAIYAWGFISMGGGFIIFSSGVYLSSIKKTMFSRKGKRGLSNWLNMLLLFFILVAIYLCFYFELLFVRKDLSKGQLYSLGPQSLNVLEQLNFPVEIKVFDIKNNNNPTHALLTLYKEKNSHIKITYIDTHKQPLFTKKYQVTRRGTYVITSQNKVPIRVMENDFVKQTIDDEGRSKVELRNEEKLTSILYSFIDSRENYCYFLTGHGERSIDDLEANGLSELKETLAIENITVRSHDLIREKSLPKEANVIVIPGPKSKFTDFDIDLLRNFLHQKGSLFILLDPIVDSKGVDIGLSQLLNEYGFEIHNDVVVDTVNFFQMNNQGSPLMPILNYDYHGIVNELKDRHLSTVFFSARSLGPKTKLPPHYIYNSILNTFKTGYGEVSIKDFKNPPTFTKGKDYSGPVCVGAVMQIRPDASINHDETRLAVYGDSGFIANHVVDIGGHKDLFVNTVRWLLNQERRLTIRPKEIKHGEVYMPARQERMAWLYFIVFQPFLLLIGGLLLIYRRNKTAVKLDKY